MLPNQYSSTYISQADSSARRERRGTSGEGGGGGGSVGGGGGGNEREDKVTPRTKERGRGAVGGRRRACIAGESGDVEGCRIKYGESNVARKEKEVEVEEDGGDQDEESRPWSWWKL